jgi:hypothetical protein
MKKLVALFTLMFCGLLLTDFTGNALCSESIVFGKTYIRETGKPQVVVDTFTVANPSGKFNLIVENGNDGTNRVSSAIISTNGMQVFGHSDFNEQVDVIPKDIPLGKNNRI